MKPDLEVVQIGRRESFKAWEHGYPFHTVRWHFHPEYELHHVVETSGRYFVGDYIGEFEPGNLVLTGPNLPHNWISNIPEGTDIPLRSHVVQFTETFVANATNLFPELGACSDMFKMSISGVLFSPETAETVGPMLEELMAATGIRRIEIFIGILGALSRATETRSLTSTSYAPDPPGFMSMGINKALAYINDNLTDPFSEKDLAEIAKLSPGAFSRSFRRHTGQALTQYVNRLRINLACQLLMSPSKSSIIEVCFSSGFSNLSNFNRQFRAQKGMTPSQFRKFLEENKSTVQAA